MRPGLALLFVLSVVGCGGAVSASGEVPVADTTGGAPAGNGAGAGSSAAAAGGSSSDAGRSSLEPSGGRAPGDEEPATDAGAASEVAGGAGGHHGPSFVSAAGTAGSTEITRTVVDAPLARRGFLSGTQYRAAADTASVFTIDAIFETTRGQWDGCTKVQLGECWYYDCPPGSASYLPSVPLQNAGAVSLTTASKPSTTVDLPLLYDYWYEANGTGELWPMSGRSLTFAATGSTVPAFSLALQSPPTVVLGSVNGEVAPTAIERSEGATLRWTSSGTGIAYFSLYGLYERKFAAVCEFAAAANAGTLPAALLQELQPGTDYRMIFRGTSRSHATLGGWELDASLAGYGGPADPYDPPVVELR